MEERYLDEKKLNILKYQKAAAMAIDVYGASGPLAIGAAAATSPLAVTPLAFIPAGFTAIAALTESLDIATGPLSAAYIYYSYGNVTQAGLEAILEMVPFATDLYPGVSIAHNIYLDQLKDEGYHVPDDLYVLPKLYEKVKPGIDVIQEKSQGIVKILQSLKSG